MSGDTWVSDGPCPFLTCFEAGRHEHAICPECDTVRYGNPFNCATCNTVANAEQIATGHDPIPLARDMP